MKINKTLIAIIVLIVLYFTYNSCEQKRRERQLVAQLSEYQLKLKVFDVKRLSDSSTIATQTQTLMSQKDAIALGLLQLDNDLRKAQAQVREKTEIKVVEKPVPFIPDGWADTTGLVRDGQGNILRRDSIAVPTRFQLKEKYFSIDGYVKKSGLDLDSLSLPNKTTITIAKKKSGFLNLRSDPVVRIKNDNPYVNVVGLDNVVIKNKKHFYQSTLFHILLGMAGGYYIKTKL